MIKKILYTKGINTRTTELEALVFEENIEECVMLLINKGYVVRVLDVNNFYNTVEEFKSGVFKRV